MKCICMSSQLLVNLLLPTSFKFWFGLSISIMPTRYNRRYCIYHHAIIIPIVRLEIDTHTQSPLKRKRQNEWSKRRENKKYVKCKKHIYKQIFLEINLYIFWNWRWNYSAFYDKIKSLFDDNQKRVGHEGTGFRRAGKWSISWTMWLIP